MKFCAHTWFQHNGMHEGTFCTNCGMVTMRAPQPCADANVEEVGQEAAEPTRPSMARRVVSMLTRRPV